MFSTHYTNPASLIALDCANISAATKTLDMAIYSLTEPHVIDAIEAKAKALVVIRLYLDRTELEAEAHGDATLNGKPLAALLNLPALSIKVKESSILMHLKSYCVDGTVLRSGSTNFSPLGESEQDNDLILTDDPAAVALFKAKFEAMWARPDNLSIAQAVARPAGYVAKPHRSL